MNQILNKSTLKDSNLKTDNGKNKFFIIIIFCIFLIISTFSIYLFMKYEEIKKEKLSKNLISNFNIMTLYTNTNNQHIIKEVTSNRNTEPFVIGLLQIDEIDITYPILSTSNEELLKISPCRFYGPMPNELGNLCIAGHNYINNKHFSKIDYLNIGSCIKIYNLDGEYIDYLVYEKKEISSDDISCTNQETNGFKEITLITCNNIKGNRVCLKAREEII